VHHLNTQTPPQPYVINALSGEPGIPSGLPCVFNFDGHGLNVMIKLFYEQLVTGKPTISILQGNSLRGKLGGDFITNI
jgi:hypothetical protein